MFDHFLSGVKIGNNAFAHRADGLDGTRCAAQHQFRVFAHSQHFFHAVFDVVSHNGRFRKNDAFAFNVDQSVGSPEVNRHVGREETTKIIENGHVLRPCR